MISGFPIMGEATRSAVARIMVTTGNILVPPILKDALWVSPLRRTAWEEFFFPHPEKESLSLTTTAGGYGIPPTAAWPMIMSTVYLLTRKTGSFLQPPVPERHPR